MNSFAPYFLAHRIAADMDRRGMVPGLALRLLIQIPSFLIVIGMAGVIAFTVADFTLWEAGLIR